MNEHDPATYSLEARRKTARKTALVMALIALGIFVAFMLKGVLG
ncbi:MAG: hypothetical protein Q4G62_03565 [Pseudomonadota bacterium]|nr:hypothetical protein [Pseudomonadota bacterium]